MDRHPNAEHALEPYAKTAESGFKFWRDTDSKTEKYSYPFVIPVNRRASLPSKIVSWVPVRLKLEVFEAPAPVGTDFRWRVVALGLDPASFTPLRVMKRKEATKGLTFARKALQAGGRAAQLMYDDLRLAGISERYVKDKMLELVELEEDDDEGEAEDEAVEE